MYAVNKMPSMLHCRISDALSVAVSIVVVTSSTLTGQGRRQVELILHEPCGQPVY